MNIAVFSTTYLPVLGGAQISIHNVLSRLSKYKNCNVILFIPRNIYNKLKNYENKLLTYEIYSLPPKFIFFCLNSQFLAYLYFKLYYKLFFRDFKIDVAWLNFFFPVGVGITDYLKKIDIPYIVTGRGGDIQKNIEVNYGFRINPKFEKKIIEILIGCKYATCISNSIVKDYLDLGVPESKIKIITNGIDFKKFNIKKDTDIRKKYKINSEKKIILTVGRYTPKKGFEYIPKIIENLIELRNDFIWLIVGKNIEENLFIDPIIKKHIMFIKDLSSNFDGSFDFPSEDIIDIYKNSDVFVFPTVIESFGNVTLEALAAGVPVITSDAPGSRDIINNNVNGTLIEIGNVKEFTQKINFVLEKKHYTNKLIRNGYKTAKSFDYDNIVPKYYELLKSLVD